MRQKRTTTRPRTTPYLDSLINSGVLAVEKQYHPLESSTIAGRKFSSLDPLQEDAKYTPIPGIIHKYTNRILWLISYRCAAYCQFCSRIRHLDDPVGDMSPDSLEGASEYIRAHPGISDVLLSGGDPLFTPLLAEKALSVLSGIPSVKTIRIGTRLPFQSPASFETAPLLRLLKQMASIADKKPIYIQLHVNHPDELTEPVLNAISRLRATHCTLVSQSVFINGLNDSVEVLQSLFERLYSINIIPYYIYHCDSIAGFEPYVCSLELEREIMGELTRRLPGLAVPTHIVDLEGRGKIPVPSQFWPNVNASKCADFDGNLVNFSEETLVDGQKTQAR